jgi:hypothetical protein
MPEPFRSITVPPPNLLPIPDAAPLVPCAPASLASRPFRDKLGIPYYQIGGRIFFDPDDIERWRAARRIEPVPA